MALRTNKFVMRIGILGGTFDPIHNGHLEMALRIKSFFNCSQMLLMPAYSPPHKAKDSITSPYHRYAMAILATAELADLEVSRLELELPSRPFTVQTIAQLREFFGSAIEMLFIMGADSFQELDTWREYQRLIASCQVVVITRPGYQLDLAERHSALQVKIEDLRGRREPLDQMESATKIFVTDLLERDISATAIRAAVAEQRSIEQWVPTAVAKYIDKYRLYQEKNENYNKCN